jgi:ribose transport system substrate-binding protein
MRVGAKLLFIVSLAVALAGCGSGTTATNDPATPGAPAAGAGGTDPKGPRPLVFFSQANSADPWRQVFDKETKAAAALHKADFDFDMQTAGGDSNHQIEQIETELVKKPKVMIVSPDSEAVKSAIEKAHDAGVKVVLLDRAVSGDKWDVYVGGDNHAIGFQAGQFMGQKLNGKGTILMIQGKAAVSATTDRAAGFMEAMSKFPGIKVIAGDNCDYERAKADTYMENFLQSHKPFDAVYAHNDEMAIGALMAMQSAHTPKKLLVGIDGCQKEVVDKIKAGEMDATFSYPDPGPKGIDVALSLIAGQTPGRKVTLATTMVTKENADAYLAAHPDLAKKG